MTGASRGIGAAIAYALAREGAAIGVNYLHSRDGAQDLVAEIARRGRRALAVGGDVCSEDDMQAATTHVTDAFGPIDTLICSATGSAGGRPSSLLDQQPAHIGERVTNQRAAILVPARSVVPAMVVNQTGQIVAISSGWSRRPSPGSGAVAIAKAAADAAIRSLAVELGPHGVRANVIAPGFVNTERSAHLPAPVREAIIAHTPLRRAAEPEEVAAVVLALCLPSARQSQASTCRLMEECRSLRTRRRRASRGWTPT